MLSVTDNTGLLYRNFDTLIRTSKFIKQSKSQQVNNCPCSAGCPNGCPCPVYECPLTSISVLVLNTYKSYNVPVLTDINGNVQTINFEVENDVHVDRSCGVQFKGDFYVYGSYLGDKRQIAKVTNCSLKRIGTLPFTHFIGACAATKDQVFLCFDYNGDKKTCRAANEPTGKFNRIAKSTHKHSETRIAANDGKLLYLIENTKKIKMFYWRAEAMQKIINAKCTNSTKANGEQLHHTLSSRDYILYFLFEKTSRF